MSSYKNIAIDGGVVLAGSTGYLYCAGTAKWGGYLGTLKLDSDVLGRSFYHILYEGFLVSFLPTLLVLFLLALISFAYAYIVLPAWIDWVSRGISQKRQAIRLKRLFVAPREVSRHEKSARKKAGVFIKIFAVVLTVLVLLAHFEHEGKVEAENLLNMVKKHDVRKSFLVTVSFENRSRKLLFLACGSRVCAGMDQDTHRVLYYNYSRSSFVLFRREKEVSDE